MPTNKRILEQVQKIRSVAAGDEAAYVARSRLGRLMLSCLRLVSAEVGLEEPKLPRTVKVPENTSPQISAIASTCNRILELSKNLCQPSEPLDERWKAGWKFLLRELDLLEDLFENR